MDLFFPLPQIQDGEDKASPFKNCLRNNYRHLKKWAKRSNTNCFRIYDRHIPQYPLAIDFYGGRFCIHYFPRSYEDVTPPDALICEVEEALQDIFGSTTHENMFWRTRIIRKKTEQYEKSDQLRDFFTVFEYGAKFQVNLTDYLDTGLFLDHRETRRRVAQVSKGKRVLNLFAYTCSFSIHAALAGASFTKSVDMSNTYTQWGERNFILNGLPLAQHEIVREDCFQFLQDEIERKVHKYDIIIIDPPTISRSKKMKAMFDIQVDYEKLIQMALVLLSSEGTLFFSTNSRTFRFDTALFSHQNIRDITDKTIPEDFLHKKIHKCWEIR
ncbi:MAG: class I SAM-dependent methyltransferase [Chlamydia sp.]